MIILVQTLADIDIFQELNDFFGLFLFDDDLDVGMLIITNSYHVGLAFLLLKHWFDYILIIIYIREEWASINSPSPIVSLNRSRGRGRGADPGRSKGTKIPKFRNSSMQRKTSS